MKFIVIPFIVALVVASRYEPKKEWFDRAYDVVGASLLTSFCLWLWS